MILPAVFDIIANEKAAQPAKVQATFSDKTTCRGQSIISDEKKQGVIDMVEEWRDIANYVGLYQVSDQNYLECSQ